VNFDPITLKRAYNNCDSTVIRLRVDSNEKWTCSFFRRVERRQRKSEGKWRGRTECLFHSCLYYFSAHEILSVFKSDNQSFYTRYWLTVECVSGRPRITVYVLLLSSP